MLVKNIMKQKVLMDFLMDILFMIQAGFKMTSLCL